MTDRPALSETQVICSLPGWTPPIDCSVEPEAPEIADQSVLERLACIAYPDNRKGRYSGRIRSMASLLGLTVSSYLSIVKPCKAHNLSVPVAEKALAICQSYVARYSALSRELEAFIAAKKLRQQANPKGFLDVRVRDASGIPRTGRAQDGGNAPGFAIPPKKR